MSVYRAYWILWWFAVLSTGFMALFMGAAPFIVGRDLLFFDALATWILSVPALLGVIALGWGAAGSKVPFQGVYRIVWWITLLWNVLVATYYGRIAVLVVFMSLILGTPGDVDWYSVALDAGSIASGLLVAVALIWGMTPPVTPTRDKHA
jgi:hypothetical protein